jgi:hypothetical protein
MAKAKRDVFSVMANDLQMDFSFVEAVYRPRPDVSGEGSLSCFLLEAACRHRLADEQAG